MQNMRAELSCPITLELLEDPINVPCCGKAVNRAALLQCFANLITNCPMCGIDISQFDIIGAPKNVNLAGLVEILLNEHRITHKHKWSATIVPLISNTNETLTVAELKLSIKDAKFLTKPCLFIAVVDQSGSMAGQAWNQVLTALVHIMSLTNSNKKVATKIITYQSCAQYVDTEAKSLNDIITMIQQLRAGGGTHFGNAFKEVKNVLDQQNLSHFSSITITFLTDGQAESSVTSLADDFK